MQGEWCKVCNDYSINTTYAEPHSPWQKRAEGHICETKCHIHRKMKVHNVPKRLWSYCAKWSCDVRNKTSSPIHALEGRTPYEAIYGPTPDTSSLCEFDFYEPIWYYEQNAFPEDKRIMGRQLGEAHKIGQALCYWVLPSTGIPIARSTDQPIADSDKSDEQVQAELVALDKAIQEKLVHGEISNDLDILEYLCYEDGDEEDEHITPQFEPVDKDAVMPEADVYSHEDYDNYIASEVLLPQGDTMVLGKVISRKQDADGNPIGTASNNPIFDTRLYQVQFLMVMLRNLAQI